MNIVVCIKQVPDTTEIKINPVTGTLIRDGVPSIYSHWIARDFFSYLTLGAGGRSRADFLRIMNRPNRYFSRAAFPDPQVSFDSLLEFYADKDWM